MSDRTYLYRFYDEWFSLLYVGITSGIVSRFEDHMKSKSWWDEARHIDIERYDTRAAALAAEKRAIRRESPLHNIQHGTAAPKPPERAVIRGQGFTSPADLIYVMRAWGLSNQALGDIFGVTRQAVSKWVAHGIPIARVDEFERLARATEDVITVGTSVPLAALVRRRITRDGRCILQMARGSRSVDEAIRLLNILKVAAA